MSALGQKRTSEHNWIMSALPPKADIGTGPSTQQLRRFVTLADAHELFDVRLGYLAYWMILERSRSQLMFEHKKPRPGGSFRPGPQGRRPKKGSFDLPSIDHSFLAFAWHSRLSHAVAGHEKAGVRAAWRC